MALEFSFMMEAWASLSNTVLNDFFVSTFWGRNISFTQRASNIWLTISLITRAERSIAIIIYSSLALRLTLQTVQNTLCMTAYLSQTWTCPLSELWASGRECRAFPRPGWRTWWVECKGTYSPTDRSRERLEGSEGIKMEQNWEFQY